MRAKEMDLSELAAMVKKARKSVRIKCGDKTRMLPQWQAAREAGVSLRTWERVEQGHKVSQDYKMAVLWYLLAVFLMRKESII